MYQGMQWFKCDLQVQTPEDARHWNDRNLKLSEPRRPKVGGVPNESDIQDKAKTFLRRCHELELQVIGITDHNFSQKTDPRDWFLTHLVEQNKVVARELDRTPIYILPGFEVDLGFHALCLFAPAKKERDIRRVNEIMTRLGLAAHERFDRGGPRRLRHNDDPVGLKKLLETVQGKHKGIVIAAHSDQADGIFVDGQYREEFLLDDLHCVEVTQNPPNQRYKRILEGKDKDWSRGRAHPAYIMSSDCKSLATEESGRPVANALGYRHTWIKISKPSIEALKQAFHDHNSRVLLPEDAHNDVSPSVRENHPRILSVEVSNAEFLSDQTIHLSPNMNCLIGGRGSGKSTILESMRITFGKDKNESHDSETKVKIDRVKKMLGNQGAAVAVNWQGAQGDFARIIFSSSQGITVEGREIADLATFLDQLSVQFFSQQQLNKFTESDQNRLLTMIDRFIQSALQDLTASEDELTGELRRLFNVQDQLLSQKSQKKRLQQELADIDTQLKARQALQWPAKEYQAALAAEHYINETLTDQESAVNSILSQTERLKEDHETLPDGADSWLHSDWFKGCDSKIIEAKKQFFAQVEAAASTYKQVIREQSSSEPGVQGILQELEGIKGDFKQACQQHGLTPREIDGLEILGKQKEEKEQQLQRILHIIEELSEQTEAISDVYTQLWKVWKEQYELRKSAILQTNDHCLIEEKRLIEVSIDYSSDHLSFLKSWNEFSPNRNSKLGRRWDDLGQWCYDNFGKEPGASIWQFIANVAKGEVSLTADDLEVCPELLKEYKPKLT